MYHLVYTLIHLLAFCILSHARHTVFISSDGSETDLSSTSEPDICMTPTCVIAAADVLTSLDETLDPCDDFYSFACGGWIKRQEVSDSQPEISAITRTKNDLNRKLRDMLESDYKNTEPPFAKMLKDFYKACVDLEKEGSEPLKKMLRRLGGWPVVEGSQWNESTFDWVDTLILFRKLGYNYEVLLDLYPDFGFKHKERLSLSNPFLRELDNIDRTLGLDNPEIASYYRMMVKAATLLGADESVAEKELLEALNFEIAFINTMYVKTDGSEKRLFSVEYSISELQQELPQVPWLKLINGLILVGEVYENYTILNVSPNFLTKFVDLMTSSDKRVIANYMLWSAVRESIKYLPEEWKDIEKKDENEKSSKKSKNLEDPRWKECLTVMESKMDIALSSYYVRNYFSEESKDKATEMMKYILKEFLKMLKENDWMDEETRKKAEEKANAIKAYIGYPDELLNDTLVMKTCEKLTITNDSFLANSLMFRKVNKDKLFSYLRKDVPDKSEWKPSSQFAKPIKVNALYKYKENSIVIPAGILHDTFYDKYRPNYMNFAEIGFVIGHEIIHGFDNKGRLYDKDGKQVNWWDKESDEHFRKKVKCIIDQYDNYTMEFGIKLNGEKTQNEDIADNGGLKEAYLAYHSWTKDHGTEPLLPGVNFNQNQLFWLSAAHAWCSKFQPEKLKELVLTDTHSPKKFRVIGPMSNLPEFSKDFNCSPEAPMNRKYKCEVW